MNNLVQITGFVSDPAWPAVVAEGHTLVVQDTGMVTVEWSVTLNILGQSRGLQLRLNGVGIDSATQGQGTLTRTWSGHVADGDLITVWHTTGAGIGSATAAHVDVIPA